MKKLALCIALATPVAFPACGSSDDGGPETGALTIAMTDAASLELSSLQVEVVAIQLHKASGAVIGALSAPVRLDLVSLTDLSQVLSLVELPPGMYTQVRVTFDFSKARAHILGTTGPATILDWEGNPLPPLMTLPIVVGNGLSIAMGRHRLLELDFDLDQSVRVDQPNNVVFVEPMLIFRIDYTDPKDLLVLGALKGVNGNVIELDLQDVAGVSQQTLNVVVDPNTVYQVDGVPMTGAPGLAAIAGMPVGTSVQAYGIAKPASFAIASPYVEAGTGTYNGGLDIVEGHVVGRVGTTSPTLTVVGNTNDASHTVFESNVTVTIRTDALNTRVVPHGAAQPFSLDDLNVGQRVRAYGHLNGPLLEASLPNSVIRAQPSHAFGFALGAPSDGNLAFDLVQVDLLDETAFQWSDGGPTPVDPDSMLVATGSLATGLGIGAGTPVDLRGYFSTVSQAQPDFAAISAANLSAASSLLLVQNRVGGTGASLNATVAPGELELVFSGALAPFELATLDQGYLGSSALPFGVPLVASGSTGNFLYRDRQTGVQAYFNDYDDFLALVNKAVIQGAEVSFFGARGAYDAVANEMQVSLAAIVVE